MQADQVPKRYEARRILITSNLGPPNVGGVENSLKHLAKEGKRNGHLVSMIVSDHRTNNETEIEVEPGIEVTYYKAHRAIPQPARLIVTFISALRAYKHHRRSFKPEVTIARYHLNVIAARLAGLSNITYVVPGIVAHQNNRDNYYSSESFGARLSLRINKTLQAAALRLSHRNVVFSSSMAEQIKVLHPHVRFTQAKPGVDLTRFKPRKQTENRAQSNITLLCVGRLVPAKGFEIAIEAMRLLPNEFALGILGEGSDRERLEQLTRDLQLTDRVRFLGASRTPEEYYATADFLLMTSKYEPFGQILLEASACGVPVVAFRPSSDVMTATEEILGEHATYAKQPTPESLASAIIAAHHRIKQEGVNWANMLIGHVTNNYSWKRLYSELTDQRC